MDLPFVSPRCWKYSLHFFLKCDIAHSFYPFANYRFIYGHSRLFLSCWFHVWRISCPSFAHESLRLSLFCQNILFFLVLFEGRDRRYWCNVQMKIIWKKHFSLLSLSPGIKICAVYKVAKSFRLGMGSLAMKVCCHSAVYPLDQLNSIWNFVFLF